MTLEIDTLSLPHAEHAALAEQTLASFRHHHEIMGLGGWNISLNWLTLGDDRVMQTNVQPEYYRAVIDVDLTCLAEKPQHMPSTVRHELFHVIIWQYTEFAEALALKSTNLLLRKLEERTVSDLSRMPLWDSLSTDQPSDQAASTP